jgi:hypothetical protein
MCVSQASTVRALSSGGRNVGLHPMGPGLLCDRVDEPIVPAGEDNLMTGLRSQFDESRADALAASGYEKARC